MCLEVVAGAKQFQGMVLWVVSGERVCGAIALPTPLQPSLPVCWAEPGGVEMWDNATLQSPSLSFATCKLWPL